MTWITEDPTPIYAMLAVVTLALAIAGYATGLVRYYLWSLAAVAAAALVFFVDWLVVTDREYVQELTQELAAAAQAGDMARLERLFSDESSSIFQGLDKKQLMDLARRWLPRVTPREIVVWGFQIEKTARGSGWRCRCLGKASGTFGGFEIVNQLFQLEVTYFKDRTGQWRIWELRIYNFGAREEIRVSGVAPTGPPTSSRPDGALDRRERPIPWDLRNAN
ncbi:MAG: hypothetical protein C4297_10420 [Gemmataceae bacterium]